MVAELCEDDPFDSALGESIFEPGSRMGLQLEESEDHWIRDETTATWTRVIVIPRKTPYCFEEVRDGRGRFRTALSTSNIQFKRREVNDTEQR